MVCTSEYWILRCTLPHGHPGNHRHVGRSVEHGGAKPVPDHHASRGSPLQCVKRGTPGVDGDDRTSLPRPHGGGKVPDSPLGGASGGTRISMPVRAECSLLIVPPHPRTLCLRLFWRVGQSGDRQWRPLRGTKVMRVDVMRPDQQVQHIPAGPPGRPATERTLIEAHRRTSRPGVPSSSSRIRCGNGRSCTR